MAVKNRLFAQFTLMNYLQGSGERSVEEILDHLAVDGIGVMTHQGAVDAGDPLHVGGDEADVVDRASQCWRTESKYRRFESARQHCRRS